mgnify:FL=1
MSDGAGALADPQGQSHGAGLADGFRLAAVGDGGRLQAVAAVVVHRSGEHVAGLLEELLLGHGLVPLVDLFSVADGRGALWLPVCQWSECHTSPLWMRR